MSSETVRVVELGHLTEAGFLLPGRNSLDPQKRQQVVDSTVRAINLNTVISTTVVTLEVFLVLLTFHCKEYASFISG